MAEPFDISSVYVSPIEYNSAIYIDDIFFPVDKKRTLSFLLNDIPLQMVLYTLHDAWIVDSIEHGNSDVILCPHCGHLTEQATYCIGFSQKQQQVLFYQVVTSPAFRLQGIIDFPDFFS